MLKHMMVRALRRVGGGVAMAAVAGAGCSGIFDVEDPQAFGDDDLNDPAILGAVASGVEGSLHQAFDDLIVISSLLGDEIEETSTWIDWRDISLGRIRADWPTPGSFSGPQDGLLRARFAAQDAAARIEKVLGSSAATNPLVAQVKWVDAAADLLIGMTYCEGPEAPNGKEITDAALIKQSITKFGAALTAATAANNAAWINATRALRARAYLLDGQYDQALADAQAVPDNFEKLAIFADAAGNQQSLTGNQLHANRNRSGGLRQMYFSRVRLGADGVGALTDHFDATKTDPRMAVSRRGNALGVNNQTPHYSIEKYNSRGNDIVMTSGREMRLIRAEVYMRRGDFASMTAQLNLNRAAAGLPALTLPANADAARALLLNERFAQLFVEGHRLADLNRFDLVASLLGTGRAKKLPMSRNEIINNANIPDQGQKCPAVS
ncbi:MAG: RagB/SusD family nutrient uptake outer membrane protein [Gemmatimonadaceae bacterium]